MLDRKFTDICYHKDDDVVSRGEKVDWTYWIKESGSTY